MKKSGLEKAISRLLNEKETFMMEMILLVHMKEDEKYNNLTQLIYLFDSYRGFKQFLKYFEGKTIQVPTLREHKQALRLLDLFQKVYIDKKDFDECYTKLKLNELGITKEYSMAELDKFNKYLTKNGDITLKQLKKLSKLK